jgi:hypothetical protein
MINEITAKEPQLAEFPILRRRAIEEEEGRI